MAVRDLPKPRDFRVHFGRGLAATTDTFGKLGEAPTHPQLLNWLAAELNRATQPISNSVNKDESRRQFAQMLFCQNEFIYIEQARTGGSPCRWGESPSSPFRRSVGAKDAVIPPGF